MFLSQRRVLLEEKGVTKGKKATRPGGIGPRGIGGRLFGGARPRDRSSSPARDPSAATQAPRGTLQTTPEGNVQYLTAAATDSTPQAMPDENGGYLTAVATAVNEEEIPGPPLTLGERVTSGFAVDGGENMVQEMNEAVATLKQRVIEEKKQLSLEEVAIDELELQIQKAETNIAQLQEQAHPDTSSVKTFSAEEEPANRQERIAQLQSKIADMQAELAEEQLESVREETDSLLVQLEMRQEDSSYIARSVSNLEAEIETLVLLLRMAQKISS